MDPNSNLANRMERLELNPSRRSITDAFLEDAATHRRKTTASTRIEYARALNKVDREFKTFEAYQQKTAEMIAKLREQEEVYNAAKQEAVRLAKLLNDLTV